MVRSKPPSSRKPKRGVDFKKIKHKIGRKLPPPRNTTNTQIKSKAIVLPEQSIVTDRAGLATNKKGLTLRELLQQTSHHNPKIRKAALSGVRDLVVKHPSELKLHKLSIIEKLRERICDSDKIVRETLFQFLKTIIFPTSKEDITAPVISLMMAYILNAMTHMTVDIRLMAFKFFELVVTNFPSSFMLHAEKVVDNYIDILRNHQIYLADKAKLKTALGGLLRCLSLLSNKNRENTELNTLSQQTVRRRGLYAFKQEVHDGRATNGFPSIGSKITDLLPVLISSFLEHTSAIRATAVIDAQSFDCMLCTLQCIDMTVRICDIKSLNLNSEILPSSFAIESDTVRNRMNEYLRRLWDAFPIGHMYHSLEKKDDKNLILNISIVEIFLNLTGWEIDCCYLDEKLLKFIEYLILLKVDNIVSVLPFIPRLVSKVADCWKFRILEAFTNSFKDSKLEAKLILPYLSAVEELLFNERYKSSLQTSVYPSLVDHQVAWLREIPELLLSLGDKHSSLTVVVLKLLLRIGQTSLANSPLGFEYDNLQYTLKDFFCTKTVAGSIHYGAFLKLPVDCKELAICCIYYFSSLNSDLLESLALCCFSKNMESFMLLRVVEVLYSAYKAGHILISDHISFLVTLIARFEVFREGFVVVENYKDSYRKFFRSLTNAVLSCLSQMGDNSVVLMLLCKSLLNAMSLKPPLDNMHGLLGIIIALDKRPTLLLEESISSFSTYLAGYMVNAASYVPENLDAASRLDKIENFHYFMKPSNVLFYGSEKLLDEVLKLLDSHINGDNMLLDSHCDANDDMETPTRVHAVASILIFMHNDPRLYDRLSSNKAAIKCIMLSIQKLLDSSRTYESRHRIRTMLDHLKGAILNRNGGTEVIS